MPSHLIKTIRLHVIVAGIASCILASGLHETIFNKLTDLRFSLLSRPATGQIVVVAIDALSIKQIGTWPWQRSLHADFLSQLDRAEAADTAFDIDFSTPSETDSDRRFADALKASGGSVVLPVFRQELSSAQHATAFVNRPLKAFSDNSWPALVNVAIEPDGLVRRYGYGETLDNEFLPTMGATLAGKHVEQDNPFWIDFGIRASSIPIVSYVDVLRGQPETIAKLKNKKIIIGGTALELGDRFSVPHGTVMPGPLLQALAAESILQDRALRPTSNVLSLAICVALVMLLMLVPRTSAIKRAILLLAISCVAEAAAVALQALAPVILDTAPLHVFVVIYLGAIAITEIRMRGLLGRIAERRFERIAMSLGDGLVCVDHNQTVTVWNPQAVQLFGLSRDNVIGRHVAELCKREIELDQPRFSAIFAQTDTRSPDARGQVAQFRAYRGNGDAFPLEVCLSSWQGEHGTQYGALLRDISVREREAERIRHLAAFDQLTNLPNRNSLIAHIMQITGKTSENQIGLLLVSIDNFEKINDMLGHSHGDLVLRAAGQTLLSTTQDYVARTGDNEFAIVLSHNHMSSHCEQVCTDLLAAFDKSEAGEVAGRPHRLRISLGFASMDDSKTTAEELLGNAHLALYRAKMSRATSVQFSDDMREELERRVILEADLSRAVLNSEFELYYQPQLCLVTGALIGAEALIRWNHPTRGLISPAEFMPVIHESPLSSHVANWVLKTAIQQSRQWELSGHRIRVGINLSPCQLHNDDLPQIIEAHLQSTGLSPELIELEVTEDILLDDTKRALQVFLAVQALNVRLVFDDFGTGYAGLSYLKTFPLDGLKIDQTFVRNLTTNPNDAAIVESTIRLSHALGLSVIAEGIEDQATRDLLVGMGCGEGQGYFFGRPMPVIKFGQALLLTIADQISITN